MIANGTARKKREFHNHRFDSTMLRVSRADAVHAESQAEQTATDRTVWNTGHSNIEAPTLIQDL